MRLEYRGAPSLVCDQKPKPGSTGRSRDWPELWKSRLLISWTCSRIALFQTFFLSSLVCVSFRRRERDRSCKDIFQRTPRCWDAKLNLRMDCVCYVHSECSHESKKCTIPKKDQFLLRFYILICYAILYFLERRSFATHISLFYSLRNVFFSVVRVQEDILCWKKKSQDTE